MANFGRALQSVGRSNPIQNFQAVTNLGLSFEKFEARKKEEERRNQPANLNADPIFLNMPPAGQQLLQQLSQQGGFSKDGNGTVGAKEDLLKKISDSPQLSSQFTRLKFENDFEAAQKANSDLSNAVIKTRNEGGDTSRNNPKLAKLFDAAELLGSRLGKTRGVNDKTQSALQGFNKDQFDKKQADQQKQQAFSQLLSNPALANDPVILSAQQSGDIVAAQKRAGEVLKANKDGGNGSQFGKINPTDIFNKATKESRDEFIKGGSKDFSLLVPKITNNEDVDNLLKGKDAFDATIALNKQFVRESKNFITSRNAFATIEAASEAPSPAGDLALVFAFMKVLDPTSTVRESEQRLAAGARDIPQSIINIWTKAKDGKTMEPPQRADFVDRANRLFKRRDVQHKRRSKFFTEQANRFGLDPKAVVSTLTDPATDEKERKKQEKIVPPEVKKEVDDFRSLFFGGK